MSIFPNVWYSVGCAVLVFLATLAAAVYVGYREGSYGCGGGTVGAMIPVMSGFAGLLVGVAVQFVPGKLSKGKEGRPPKPKGEQDEPVVNN